MASASTSSSGAGGGGVVPAPPAGQAQPPQANSIEDSTFAPLQRASNLVDEKLARDERWIGIGDSLGGATSSDYIFPPNPAWAPFRQTRSVNIPDRLWEEQDLTQAQCGMGLLPEIERSWVTINNRFLLWDWANGASFMTFDELNDVIVGVGLVKPRPGVFVDSISHLLVLTTANHITLVGLGYSSPSSGAPKEVTFYLTGLSVPTDGISLTTIRGTSSGRIFLASSHQPLTPGGIGGDGCLYELVYQSSESWFVKRCTLYNLSSGSIVKSIVPSFLRSFTAVPTAEWVLELEVDNERGLLYTLLRNGTIEMWQLPSTQPGAGFDGQPTKVAKNSNVLNQALVICPGSPMLNARNFKIMSLEVVSVREGGNGKIGLVAITSTGVRLYFSHQKRNGYGGYYAGSSQPSVLELYHVRPPPSPTTTAPPAPSALYGQPQPPPPPPSQQPPTIAFNNVIQAKYSSGGLLLAANNLPNDIDVLFLASPEIGFAARLANETTSSATTANRVFSEVTCTVEVQGRTWDMAEIIGGADAGIAPGGNTGLNELATQVSVRRREWVVLTNQGAFVVARQRPVDTLVEILEALSIQGNGPGSDISVFFDSYGRDESCAMLLAIAASNSKLGRGESLSSRLGSSGRIANTSVLDSAKNWYSEGSGRPQLLDQGGYGNTASERKLLFSGKHEGLAIYYSRLIRPIWKQKITKALPPSGQTNNISDTILTAVQHDLLPLRAFVEQEQQIFSQSIDANRPGPHASALQAEQSSLTGLRLLLTQSVEAISFVLLLIDYKMADIIAGCPPELQTTLLNLTYQELLTSKKGKDVARGLVNAVIHQQIGKQLSIDAISDTLQQRCGSFCSADDVLLFKAMEAIRRARDSPDSSERMESLRESLRLFIKCAKHLSFERLSEICGEYNAMRYPLGVIDLALCCAHEWDQADQAVTYWLDGQPPNDARVAAFDLRKSCHQLIFDALRGTDELLNEASKPHTASLSYEEADGLRTNAYNKVLAVKDEFFHHALYDWFLARGLRDQLLETRTPYLEGYLSQEPNTLEKLDLLWQYYIRNLRYMDAAVVLCQLALTTAFQLSLEKRVECLALAVGNAKSQFPSGKSDMVQFLVDTEERLEVAQIQVEILRAIEDLPLLVEEKVQWVNKAEDRLYNISELYSELADPLDLPEIKLLIFHVSEHREELLIEDTWTAIFSRAREALPDRPVDAVEATLIRLGRRFRSSDVAFPLYFLASSIEEFAYQQRAFNKPGWVPIALREAGVSWQDIFEPFNDLFTGSQAPWRDSPAARIFLATDIAVLLESWIAEAKLASHGATRFGGESSIPSHVEAALADYLTSLPNDERVLARLTEVKRQITRGRY